MKRRTHLTLRYAVLLISSSLFAACGLCQPSDDTVSASTSPDMASTAMGETAALSQSKGDAVTPRVKPVQRPSALKTLEFKAGANLRNPALIKDRQKPWAERFGDDYIAFVDAKVIDGRLFACSSVDGLMSAEITSTGTLQNLQHLGPDHPKFKRYPGGGKSSRCGRIAKGYGFLYAVHRGDSFLSPSYLALYSLASKEPTLVHVEFPSKGSFSSVAVDAHRVFVGMEGRGVQVFKKQDGRLVSGGMVSGISSASDVAYWGGRLYVASPSEGLIVVDVTDHRKEKVVAKLKLDAAIQGLTYHPWSATMIVLGGSKGFASVDMKDPNTPKLSGWTATKGAAVRADVTQQHLVVADYESVRLYDMSDPPKPVLKARRRIPSGPMGALTFAVATSDSFVYAASWYGIEVFRTDLSVRSPIAEFAKRELTFKAGEKGMEATTTVRNTGTHPLKIGPYEAPFSGLATPKDTVILPGEEQRLTFSLNAQIPEEESGILTVHTDDPHQARVRLTLTPPDRENVWPVWSKSVRFTDEKNRVVDLSVHRGKVVVLAYFASFCPPCFKEFPELEQELWQPLKKKGVLVYGVAGPTDDATLRERFREQTGVTFPFLLSTPPPAHLLAKDAMVTYYPFHLVIDGTGQVVHAGKDLHTSSLLQAVRRALGAAPKP